MSDAFYMVALNVPMSGELIQVRAYRSEVGTSCVAAAGCSPCSSWRRAESSTKVPTLTMTERCKTTAILGQACHREHLWDLGCQVEDPGSTSGVQTGC
ncbi:hypothetical protein AAFF_G00219850 [Aldrovandia affinis]|uniref:Uncharacterized protein n=1 Tax=Aldrovandia affinis TaxID=143900 RepID=A0AAD7W4Y3_9TELE|nr:hypothetical protein AAFF_G00219850 [Aldrovandia affinis]